MARVCSGGTALPSFLIVAPRAIIRPPYIEVVVARDIGGVLGVYVGVIAKIEVAIRREAPDSFETVDG